MLWIALYLPNLTLQLATRGAEHEFPLVISKGPANRPQVQSASAIALAAGIRPGMVVAAAQALADDLQVVAENPEKEREALAQLACWASQFTPNVVIQPRQGLLLEVSSTLRIFDGLRKLRTRISDGVEELGYQALTGIAPTPLGAWLIAKAKRRGIHAKSCIQTEDLRSHLGPLPLALFDWPEETVAMLGELAVKTIDALLALPRDGLARRFGAALLTSLDQALGLLPDPRPYFLPPENYTGRVEFFNEVENVEALLFPLRRLLTELEGFLRARGAGVQAVRVLVVHARCEASRITCNLATPERNAERIHSLLRERLQRVELPAPALGVVLQADVLLPLTPVNQSWLPDGKTQAMQLVYLQEKLAARLGVDRIVTLSTVDDHRPEQAWANDVGDEGAKDVFPLRPVWLLKVPLMLPVKQGQPICRGPLQFLAGPERLEVGWWEGQVIGRDYFVSSNSDGEAFWIYREHSTPQEWFLHGVFA